MGGLGSHVSTCTILLTTLPGLTGNRKEGAEQRLSRCSPSQGHRGELHRAVTPASARTATTGPNTSTANDRKTAHFIAHANARAAFPGSISTVLSFITAYLPVYMITRSVPDIKTCSRTAFS